MKWSCLDCPLAGVSSAGALCLTESCWGGELKDAGCLQCLWAAEGEREEVGVVVKECRAWAWGHVPGKPCGAQGWICRKPWLVWVNLPHGNVFTPYDLCFDGGQLRGAICKQRQPWTHGKPPNTVQKASLKPREAQEEWVISALHAVMEQLRGTERRAEPMLGLAVERSESKPHDSIARPLVLLSSCLKGCQELGLMGSTRNQRELLGVPFQLESSRG